MIVARHHCKLPLAELEILAKLTADMRPDRQGALTQKNRDRLRQLIEPTAMLRLLHLPGHLMRVAHRLRDKPREAARTALLAVAIEIELNCPLRLKNLARTDLRVNLKRDHRTTRQLTRFSYPLGDMKNKQQSFEWPVSAELSNMLETYIREFRPALALETNTWLFPAASGNGPRAENTLATAITKAIAEHVGVEMNVHLFRSFVACMILEDNPAALEDVRLLLGHKSLSTTLAHYAFLRPAVVAARYDKVLRRARGRSTTLVRSVIRSGPRRQA
jgi:integrase